MPRFRVDFWNSFERPRFFKGPTLALALAAANRRGPLDLRGAVLDGADFY